MAILRSLGSTSFGRPRFEKVWKQEPTIPFIPFIPVNQKAFETGMKGINGMKGMKGMTNPDRDGTTMPVRCRLLIHRASLCRIGMA